MRPIHAAVVVYLLVAPAALYGQAWVAPRGETTVSLTFQRTEFEGHILPNGDRIHGGGSHSRSLALGIEHSLTDRLALAASIPYVGSKNGVDPQPVLGRTGIDDGQYHQTWQDFRFGARYNVLANPVVVTPLIAVRLPSHKYPTIGEAAVGPRLREVQVGVDAGRIFSVADQNFYIDAQYAYAIVQKYLGLSLNRSNVDVDLGYFVLPALNLRGIVSWQNTYDGLTAKEVFGPNGPPQKNPNLAEPLWLQHDRLIRDDYWRAGIGASYSVNETFGVYFTAVKMIAGRNSHYGYLYSVGVARTFKLPSSFAVCAAHDDGSQYAIPSSSKPK